MNKPHTTWKTFDLFFKDYQQMFIRDRLNRLKANGYEIVSVEARTTKNERCHMITLKWEVPTIDDEKTRNKAVLQQTSALIPVSGDIKLFWHKPQGTTQIIDATILIWLY